MIVCPQCEFENPNTNKFCQKCGTSLTHKTCPQCGAEVSFSAERCQNCHAFTGKVWWAILSKNPDSPPVPSSEQPVAIEPVPSQDAALPQPAPSTPEQLEPSVPTITTPDAPSVETLSPTSAQETDVRDDTSLPVTAAQETDVSQTIPLSVTSDHETDVTENTLIPLASTQVEDPLEKIELQSTSTNLEPSSSVENYPPDASSPMLSTVEYLDPQQRYKLLESLTNTANNEIRVRVLDCQPRQKSPLEALMDQQQSGSGRRSPMLLPSAFFDSDSWKALGVPTLAQPYVALETSLYPTLPKIHDAWQQERMVVVLLEDRSEWFLLQDLWTNDEVPILQILYWLDEMAKLWAALEPWHCRQSLLEVTNLRVDEDQTLSLQQLYPEPQDATMTLQDLGKMWQTLFNQSQRTQFNSLEQLLRILVTGEIETISQVRSHLEAIAHEVQGNTPVESTIPPEAAPVPQFLPSEFNEGDDAPTVILPMQLISLEDSGDTDTGRQRDHNEDFFAIQTQINKHEIPRSRTIQARALYILCDGMGGHAGGEVASAMAVDSIKRYFQTNWKDQLPDEDTIREAVLLANEAIYEVNQQNARSGSGRMGTTLVMVLIQDTHMAIAHVGDSRLYRLTRKQGLEKVTMDHEVGQREIQRGVEEAIAYSRPDAYQLTQALGPRDENFVKPDIQFLELHEDTLLILCSDGLTDNDLLETYWQSHLAPLLSSRANLEQGVSQLIDLANEHNGHDNITAVLIRAKVRPNLEHQKLF